MDEDEGPKCNWPGALCLSWQVQAEAENQNIVTCFSAFFETALSKLMTLHSS